jgi:hypothetical protein
MESHLERYCQASAIGLVAIFNAVVMELVFVRLSWSFWGGFEFGMDLIESSVVRTLKTISSILHALKNAKSWKTGARIGFIALVLGTIQVEGGFVAELRFRGLQTLFTWFVAVVLSSLAGAAFNEDMRTLKTRSQFMEALDPSSEAMDGQTGLFILFSVYTLCYVHIVRGLIMESHLERYCQASAIGLVAIFNAVVMELVFVRLSWSFWGGFEFGTDLIENSLVHTLKTISPVVQAVKNAMYWETTATCTTLSNYVVVQVTKNATGTSWKKAATCTTLSKYVESAFKVRDSRP